ncbi:MAG TPA: hypothetical protein VLA19_06925 [Herpetosiphonaceae bacterium]|nr:hypothetical protein [Herpetosiphonaceae bacterium]
MPTQHLPSDEEVAAALVAVALVLAEEAPATSSDGDGWRHTAKLSVQKVPPVRITVPPTWNRVERLRRGLSGGFSAIAGL